MAGPLLSWLDEYFGPAIIKLSGVFFPRRQVLEFEAGDGVEIDVTELVADKAIKVTISSTGEGGGGGGAPTGAAGGDLAGTYPNPTTAKLKGTAIGTTGGGTTGAPLVMTGANTADWAALNLALAAAVTGTLPVARGGTGKALADLVGQANKAITVNVGETGFTFTTIPAGASTPTGTGFRKIVGGVEQATAEPVDLADATERTGILPAANQAAQTMGGDTTGTTAASVVAKINGATVPAAGALTTGNLLQVTGVGALGYGALNLAGGTNYVTGTLPVARGGTGLTSLGGSYQVYRTANGGATSEWATLPVGSAGQIQTSDGGGLFAGPSNVLAGANYISVGASPSTLGYFRVPYSGTATVILGGKAAAGSNDAIITMASAAKIQICHQTAWDLDIYAANLLLWGYNSVSFAGGAGGATVVQFDGVTAKFGVPLSGRVGGGLRKKVATITTTGTFALSAAQAECPIIKYTGTGCRMQAPATEGTEYTVLSYTGDVLFEKVGGSSVPVNIPSGNNAAIVVYDGSEYIIAAKK